MVISGPRYSMNLRKLHTEIIFFFMAHLSMKTQFHGYIYLSTSMVGQNFIGVSLGSFSQQNNGIFMTFSKKQDTVKC